jgi:2-alkyl-3-oxoalkanoate reductase
MKIFVAGATGAIGRPLIAQLLNKGHHVVALTRTLEKAQALSQLGVEPAIADVFDSEAVKNAIAHAQPEVVIEQLTALPKTYTGKSMGAAAKRTQPSRRRCECPSRSASGWCETLPAAVDRFLDNSWHRISR